MTALRRYCLGVVVALTAVMATPVLAAAVSLPPSPVSAPPAGSYSTKWVSGNTAGSSWLSSVSCTAAFACVAVGGAVPYPGANDSLAGLVVAYLDGSTWIVEPTDTGDNGAVLTSVACAPTLTTMCMATGSDGASSDALTLGADGHWTRAAPLVRVAQSEGFGGTACPSRIRCFAVGASFNSASTSTPLIESWNGKHWHVAALPAGYRGGGLGSVSCASERLCVAVGSKPAPGGTYSPLAFEWTGGPTWRAASLQDPSHFTATFSGVSCAKNRCTAVGSAGADAFTETWLGGSWSAPSLYSEPRTTLEPAGISCLGGGSCLVVGNTVVAAGPPTFGATVRNGRWLPFNTSGFPLGIQALTCSQAVGACAVVGGGSPRANTRDVEPAQAGIVSY